MATRFAQWQPSMEGGGFRIDIPGKGHAMGGKWPGWHVLHARTWQRLLLLDDGSNDPTLHQNILCT